MRVEQIKTKKDGSVELRVACRLCGGKADLNPQKNCWYCAGCGQGGAVPAEWWAELSPDDREVVKHYQGSEPREKLSDLPPEIRRWLSRQGLDPGWCERRYRLQWDGARLSCPTGEKGWAWLHVESWRGRETGRSKDAGFVGEHLLTQEKDDVEIRKGEICDVAARGRDPSGQSTQGDELQHEDRLLHRDRRHGVRSFGSESRSSGGVRRGNPLHVVLTEGFLDAMSVPLPWVGLGLAGSLVTGRHQATLRKARLSTLTLWATRGSMRTFMVAVRPLSALSVDVRLVEAEDTFLRTDVRERYRLLLGENHE